MEREREKEIENEHDYAKGELIFVFIQCLDFGCLVSALFFERDKQFLPITVYFISINSNSEEDRVELHSYAANPLGPNMSMSSFMLTAKFGAVNAFALRKPNDPSWSRPVSVERATRPRVLPLAKPQDLPWSRPASIESPPRVEVGHFGEFRKRRYRISTPHRPSLCPSNKTL